jgi:hypothetical protein
MSLTENELIYLMAYVDHQVDDDELPEVHDLLERSEEARLIVAQHAALGDWVRTSNDLRAAEAGADRIASHVMTEIESLGGAKVIEIERERGRVALNRQRVKEFGTLFAIAAVVLAFWAMPTKKPDVVAVAPSTRPAGPPSASPPLPSPPGPSNSAGSAVAAAPSDSASDDSKGATLAIASDPEDTDVDVQSVDSESRPFSIFYVPAASGLNAHSSSVVVWIGE